MAPKHESVPVTRDSPRGDWHVAVPVAAFGPDGENDAEGLFVRLDGETAHVRFGAAGGTIVAATPDAERATLVVASVREMRKAVASGYENDARKGAIPSTVVAVAAGATKTLAGGAKVRMKLKKLAAPKRVAAALGILADAE